MKRKAFVMAAMGIFLSAAQALAQEKTVTGRVTSEEGPPLAGVSVVIRGTNLGTQTNTQGAYTIRASVGQVLQFRMIGTTPVERTVGADNVIDVQLRRVPTALDAVVVTALGQTTQQRALGTAQQSVAGPVIAETQRTNFVNALQGRIAGVEVTSSSGVPGASSSITIRGVSSISSNNQPLFIIDGLPLDNKTMNTASLASDAPGSATAFNNRGLDFTNRAADLNPEDIESLVVLKGPEAAALYGIDAANGAVVITTKRGRGQGGFEYSNSFTVASPNARPEVQRVYQPDAVGSSTFLYYGPKYPAGTQFFDNIDNFFRTALSQRHNLSFSGASADNRITYRLAGSGTRDEGVVPNSKLDRINLTGSSQAQVTPWMRADLSMQFTNVNNDQVFKGAGSPLIGLLVWPGDDNAKDYLTPAGTRRRLTSLSASSEVDNPFFSVERNRNTSKNVRLISNFGLTLTPFSWGRLEARLGADNYTNETQIIRDPESTFGFANNGILDKADDITRSVNAQTILNFNSVALTQSLSISGLVGNQINAYRSTTDAIVGLNFLEPGFISVNNTNLRSGRTVISERRLMGVYGQAVLDYKKYLFLTLQGRNDWTSTIPRERNSFFYPSVSTSFIFSDAFPGISRFMTGKIRAAYAEVGKDARPYAFRPSLEYKTTSYGGYGYGFTGPNLALKPEFARSYEVGTELNFLDGRLSLDATVYRKQTKDQIVNDIRGSYATGFILFNLNGAVTRNEGLELSLNARPLERTNFSWDVLANFDKTQGKTLGLPNALPESYVSDTWLFGNVRNGTAPGLSTRSLTGTFYLRNKDCELLIDPATGLPLRSGSFIDAKCVNTRGETVVKGYDRNPDFTMGITNTFRYKRVTFDFLVDIRRGGDVFNATEHFLTARGLAMRTLDREQPRVVAGVLRDGKENSDNPTRNSIVVVPAVQNNYYLAISEELFIERDINWIRLRDVQLRFQVPERYARNASIFVKGSDLFLKTNYSGLDPIVNGNTAAVGGSGAAGIDYGNFPIPRSYSFGLRVGF
jgi:TonB-linked SusC/RagA family outer membrane protein